MFFRTPVARIDAITPRDYQAFRAAGPDLPEAERDAAFAAHPCLRRYDEAFDKVFTEIQTTLVTNRPAVWLLYNMGVVVKTPQTTFATDLVHRQGVRLAPLLDFALVTHNHDDHVDTAFLDEMNAQGKTIVSNVLANYGALRGGKMPGGYTRQEKTFTLGDATVRTALSDHNDYLIDFTTTLSREVFRLGFVQILNRTPWGQRLGCVSKK
ncbi:MAG: hypothetical protein ACOX9C_08440 [Kiritimatiellia bacterium]|jgi:hypothetical protein